MLCYVKGALGLLIIVQTALARVVIPVSFGYETIIPGESSDLDVAAAEHLEANQPVVQTLPLVYEIGSAPVGQYSEPAPKVLQKPRAFEQAVAYFDQIHDSYEEEPVVVQKKASKPKKADRRIDDYESDTQVSQTGTALLEEPAHGSTHAYYDSYGTKLKRHNEPSKKQQQQQQQQQVEYEYEAAEEEPIRDPQSEHTHQYHQQVQVNDNKQTASNVHEAPVNGHAHNGEPAVAESHQKVAEQQTSNSDHHEKHDHGKKHHEQGGGKEHHGEHHSDKGEKGDKGYKGGHKHDKGDHGKHDKEGHKGHYGDDGGHKKKHHHEHDHHHEHHKGDEGKKGAEYDEKGEHHKGHSTKGEHNIHKKDEYEKKHEFYDEHHEGGDHEKHGGFHEHKEHKKGGHHKADHHKGGHEDGKYGKKEHHEKGDHHDEHKHHDKHDGHKEHHDHGHKKEEHEGKKHEHKKHYHKDSGGGHHKDNHGHGSQQAVVAVKDAKDVQGAASVHDTKHQHGETGKDHTYLVALIHDDKKANQASSGVHKPLRKQGENFGPQQRRYKTLGGEPFASGNAGKEHNRAEHSHVHEDHEYDFKRPLQQRPKPKDKLDLIDNPYEYKLPARQVRPTPKIPDILEGEYYDYKHPTREGEERPKPKVADNYQAKASESSEQITSPRSHRQDKFKSHGVHGCGP